MGTTTGKKESRKSLKHYISWFEIPVINFDRAVSFYNQIFNIHMETLELGSYLMALFPSDKGIGGALVKGDGCIPSDIGTLVYLNGGKDLSDILQRVEPAGGRIILAKTLINKEQGYFALFIDSEGNKLALHSKG